MNGLPFEIWEKIIQHMEPSAKNICAVNASCRLLRAALHSNNKGVWHNGSVLQKKKKVFVDWSRDIAPPKWKGYELKINTPFDLADFLVDGSNIIECTNYNFMSGVCDLNVLGINEDNHEILVNFFNSQKSPLLRSLTLRFNFARVSRQPCFITAVVEALHQLQSLRHLTMYFCGIYPRPVFYTFGGRRPLTSLVALTLLWCGLQKTDLIVEECPFLERVDFRLCYDLSDIDALERAIHLTHVTLYHCPGVKRLPRLPQISSLKILECPRQIFGPEKGITSDPSVFASDPSVFASDPSVFASDPSVFASDPSMFKGSTTTHAQSTLSLCTNIKTLHIGLINDDLRILPRLPPFLSTLHLGSCKDLVDISSLIDISESLKQVIIYSCNNAIDIKTLASLTCLSSIKISMTYPTKKVDLRELSKCTALQTLTLIQLGANVIGLQDLMQSRPDITFLFD